MFPSDNKKFHKKAPLYFICQDARTVLYLIILIAYFLYSYYNYVGECHFFFCYNIQKGGDI